jgi:hypothetical protein
MQTSSDASAIEKTPFTKTAASVMRHTRFLKRACNIRKNLQEWDFHQEDFKPAITRKRGKLAQCVDYSTIF